MSVVSETVTVTAAADSGVAEVHLSALHINTGAATDVAFPGVLPPVMVTAAAATIQTVVDAYAVSLETAYATSVVSPSLIVTQLLTDAARGRDTAFATLEAMAVAAAAATDAIESINIPDLVVEAALATSSAPNNAIVSFQLNETANARGFATVGLAESLEDTASATVSVVLLRSVTETSTTSATGVATVTPSNAPQAYLLLSDGNAASLITLQADAILSVAATATVTDSVWFNQTAAGDLNPRRVAWVMNTETTAVSWYNSFDFESVAQPPGKALAVGPDGLYELSGDTDAGRPIAAEVVTGFDDFGSPQTKRVDSFYFGYTSPGRLSVTTETYGSGHSPTTYFLEQRTASAPRNSRVTPGKGLHGRYWRVTIRNIEGADFEVHDAMVDIAVSTRRV